MIISAQIPGFDSRSLSVATRRRDGISVNRLDRYLFPIFKLINKIQIRQVVRAITQDRCNNAG